MQDKSKQRYILIGAAAILLIILAVILLIKKSQSQTSSPVFSPYPTPMNSYQQELQNTYGITVPSDAKQANLSDKTGGNQVGIATLETTSGQNIYTVIANLNDLPTGYFYEGWLSDGTNTMSIGKLEIAKAGWLTNYTTSQDLSDHKTVIVSIEKYLGIAPTKIILSGSFN